MSDLIPLAVQQALEDLALPPSARLMMWYLAKRLDLIEFREVKAASIAAEMHIRENTASEAIALLVARGYLDESGQRKPRALRMPWSRRASRHRAA